MTTITKLHLNGSDYDIGSEGITKIFTLSSTSDLVNAQAAYDWYANGGIPIIKFFTVGDYFSGAFTLGQVYSGYYWFSKVHGTGTTNGNGLRIDSIRLVVSSGTVTSITTYTTNLQISTTVPTSGDAITLVI